MEFLLWFYLSGCVIAFILNAKVVHEKRKLLLDMNDKHFVFFLLPLMTVIITLFSWVVVVSYSLKKMKVIK